jgi:hypothetical protein
MNILSKKDAIEYLGLEDKIFDNYFKIAGEISALKRKGNRGKFWFDKNVLKEWKKSFNWRTVVLTKKDYAKCLDFALAMHFSGYVFSDFNTGRQREFGQRITNWVKGQLGEIAVQKFLKKIFKLNVELDFEIREQHVPQDITGVVLNGKVKKIQGLKIGIKSTKPKNAYLVLGENEYQLKSRKSDVYLFCRPDIPDDHLLRISKNIITKIVKNCSHFKRYSKKIENLPNIQCEIVGLCKRKDLYPTKKIPGQEFSGKRYVLKSGDMKRDYKDWEKLVQNILKKTKNR